MGLDRRAKQKSKNSRVSGARGFLVKNSVSEKKGIK
jgi:hypothetical protein